MIVLLDAGHGKETPGKRSPDGKLLEYKYCRELVDGISNMLQSLGVETIKIVDTDEDISLSKRCRKVNSLCSKYGTNNLLLVSVHCNAAGNGSSWMNASGWSVMVGLNASENSKKLAESITSHAERSGLKVRRQYPNIGYWKQNLAICRDTKCPAVLTENLFQDNKKDVEYLLSKKGKENLVKIHVNGIIDYINNN